MNKTSLRFGLLPLTMASSATSLWANVNITSPTGNNDLSADKAFSSTNVNPPKKWTETPWLEGTQTIVGPRVSWAGFSASGLAQDLVITPSKCRTMGSSLFFAVYPADFAAPIPSPGVTAGYTGKDGVWRTIRSRVALGENRSMAPDLLEIRAAANRCPDRLRDLQGQSLTRMQTGMATIGQRFQGQTVRSFKVSKQAKPAQRKVNQL